MFKLRENGWLPIHSSMWSKRGLTLFVVCSFFVGVTSHAQLSLSALGTATQTGGTNGPNPPSLALDGNTGTFSQTPDVTNSFWEVELGRPVQMTALTVAAPSTAANGLILRVFDLRDRTLFQATISGVSAGNNWTTNLPAPVNGRIIRLGLENGQANGQGNHQVILSEVQVFGSPLPTVLTTNYAQNAEAYMTRSSDSLLPTSNVNDGNYATEVITYSGTVDGYFEVDLGQGRALYTVRAVSATGYQTHVTHTTATVFDENHQPVFAQHLGGTSDVFDINLPGPVIGRYVRVGLEYKERTDPGSNTRVFGLKELQAYGLPTNDVGLLSFSATQTQILAGASTQLNWQEKDLYELNLYPNIGSVGANTGTNGLGSRTVTPAGSTEYILVGRSHTNLFTRPVTVQVNGQALPARISEFVANNQLSFRDGNKNFPDWIELHNPNAAPLNLGGYHLSDNPAAPTKWKFPSGVILPPHGDLVVFASDTGTNQMYDAAGFLHASFSLNQDGESVLLIAPDGSTVVDAITNFPAQTGDLAYGRTLDGAWKFIEPTPGALNVAASYAGWLAPLEFSHQRGWHTNAFSLFITNSNPSSQVFWSVDGTEPALLYTGPLGINATVPVRATVRRDGYKSPRTKTHTYLFLDSILASPVWLNATYVTSATYTNRVRTGLRDLPTLCINVPPAPPVVNSERVEREASLEIFMPDGADIQENCGLTHFGGAFGLGTGNPYAKKSWQLKFRSQYGASKLKFPLFKGFDYGMLARDSFDELDLHAGNHDAVSRGFYLSHRFAADTMLEMGSLNPHGRFVNVYINGAYMGMFDAHERLVDWFLAENLGGAKEDYVSVKGNDNVSNAFILGVPEPPHRALWEQTRSNRFNYAAIKTSLDVPHFIDFMLAWNWSANSSFEAEYRAAGPIAPGSGFKFWIADADGFLPKASSINLSLNRTANPGPASMFGGLLTENHPDFKSLLADRIYQHCFNNGALTPARLERRMNNRMAEITNSMVAESARWNFRDPVSWQSDAQAARDTLFPQRTPAYVNILRNAGWYPSVDAPLLSQFGGSVSNGYALTISGSGTIYYTLDGSDPRLPGGGIAPGALVWSGSGSQPINIPFASNWRWLKGLGEASSPTNAWRLNGFNDSGWNLNGAPFQYGYSGGTILSDMRSNYTCIYLRMPFVVSNPGAINSLQLSAAYDDGFVAWVNGTEIARGGFTGSNFSYTNIASSNHAASPPEAFTNNSPPSFLLTGTNTLAIQAFNRNISTSTDFHFDAELTGGTPGSFQLILTNNTTISVRVLNGSTWSALAQTTFVVAPLKPPAPGDLLISELHYNPPGSDDYEFIELYNASSNVLDLANVRLSEGVNFIFPGGSYLSPGGFALVVENIAAFHQRYASNASPYYFPGLNVAGAWSGALANEGERISLLASNGVELAAVNYQTGGAWPGRADGEGSSLELRNPAQAASTNLALLNAHLDRGPNWRSSVYYHGTPGRLDLAPRELAISEVVSHTDVGVDWVELQNLTPAPIELAGIYLSDDYDALLRYAFAPDAVIEAGGFLVLNANQLGFGFSELGSDVLLVEAAGTNVLRFLDTVDLPAAEREEPFGRYQRSDAIVDFTELRAKTAGTNNVLPRIGPVVFTEIMYHPTNGNAEFVELVNLAGTNVLLYDPLRATNTWALSDAVEFSFPTNQLLTPGQVILVCATNPAVFRAQYGVNPAIAVYGPWSGALNNAGEALRLVRPGTPELDGSIPYYRVDRVRYEPVAPWPEAAKNGGISLERIVLEGYGNDPVNWQPSVSGGTPGTFPGNRPPTISVEGETIVMEGQPVTLTVTGTDLDQPWQTLTLAAHNSPSGSSFNTATGVFTWTPGPADGGGFHSVKFTVADSSLFALVVTQTVAITVFDGNQPPVIPTIPNVQHPARVSYTHDIAASDPDVPPAQPLTFYASGLPAGLQLNPALGRISGTVQAPGAYPITVWVSDNQSPALLATNQFTLTITEPFTLQPTGGVVNGQPQFSFWTIAGETYDVQYSPSLTPPNWQLLQHIESAPGGLQTIPPLPAPATGQGFVRVLWVR